jgi:hypothetical protein
MRRFGLAAGFGLGMLAALASSWPSDIVDAPATASTLAPTPVERLPVAALLRTEGLRPPPYFLDRHDGQRGVPGRALGGAVVLTAELTLLEIVVAAMSRRARAQRLIGSVLDRGPPVLFRTGSLLLS